MGSLRRKIITKPLPPNAEIVASRGERRAKWKNRAGKLRTARIVEGADGVLRIAIESKWFAKFRDGQGIVREVATGCNDEQAARSVLAKLERRAELVKGDVISAVEDTVADHRATPIATHIAGFFDYLKAADRSKIHRSESKRQIERIVRELRWKTIGDMNPEAVERWLILQAEQGISARTRNSYVQSLRSFATWLVRRGRLITNPIAGVERADQKSDRRKVRRALTAEEVARLLRVASNRPLAEYGRTTKRIEQPKDKRKRSGWTYCELKVEDMDAAVEKARKRLADNPDLIAKLERLGRERALMYKTLVLTGLRRSELASLTVGQVRLDDRFPCLELAAADEKNREGSTIPLRGDLVDDLRAWIETLAGERTSLAIGNAGSRLPASTPLFVVPHALVKILDRDLKLAGIGKKDERGRTIDVHAIRTTFSTLLSAGGVSPRTAQAALRHADLKLTMETYTDPKLLDVRGALDSLPKLPLDEKTPVDPEPIRATGTTGRNDQRTLAPLLAPRTGVCCQPQALSGKMDAIKRNEVEKPRNEKTPENTAFCDVFGGSAELRPPGLEPGTYGLKVRCSTD